MSLMEDPYRPPRSIPEELPQPQFRGIGRVSYIAISLIFCVLLDLALRISSLPADLVRWQPVLFMTGLIVPGWFRLRNIGMNPWLSVFTAVPVAGLFVLWRAAVYQEGYQTRRKLDVGGKIFGGFIIGAVVLVAGWAVMQSWRR